MPTSMNIINLKIHNEGILLIVISLPKQVMMTKLPYELRFNTDMNNKPGRPIVFDIFYNVSCLNQDTY